MLYDSELLEVEPWTDEQAARAWQAWLDLGGEDV